MAEHVCETCYKQFRDAYNLKRHLNRKIPCKAPEPIDDLKIPEASDISGASADMPPIDITRTYFNEFKSPINRFNQNNVMNILTTHKNAGLSLPNTMEHIIKDLLHIHFADKRNCSCYTSYNRETKILTDKGWIIADFKSAVAKLHEYLMKTVKLFWDHKNDEITDLVLRLLRLKISTREYYEIFNDYFIKNWQIVTDVDMTQ